MFQLAVHLVGACLYVLFSVLCIASDVLEGKCFCAGNEFPSIFRPAQNINTAKVADDFMAIASYAGCLKHV